MVSIKPTYEELEETVKALEKEVVTFKGAEEKIEHLTLILSAIRNVSQQINRERDRDKLLKGICNKLVETRGYFNAWIALLDKTGGLITTAESGLGKDFLLMIDYLKHGELTGCAERALRQADLVVTEDPLSACTDCPLTGRYAGRAGLTVQIEYGGKVYGLLSCSIPRDFISDEEEALFKEVASDISYALYSLEAEEKRKGAEEALRSSENQKKAILDASIDRIRLVDKDMRIVWANKTTTRELNVAPEDLVGHPCYEILFDRNAPCPGCPTKKALDSGEIEHAVMHQPKSKGIEGETYWDGYAIPIKSESGDIIHIMQITRNITGQKRAEEALRKGEEKYRTLFENASEAIYVTQDGKIKFPNPKMEELYGYSAEELTSKPFTYFIHEKDQKMVLERYKSRLRGEAPPGIYPFRIINKAGDTKWVEINVVSFSWEDRPAALCFLTDITERVLAEDEKKKLETQILQSEKMASVGQLAAGVAHEINNPTGFVSSNLKTLSNYQNDITKLIKQYRKLITDLKDITTKENLPSSIIKQVEHIVAHEIDVDVDFILDDILDLIKESKEGTERIKKIVLDLKDFAHPGVDKIQTTDINKGIDSTLNVVWNELKYKATVIKEYGDLPQVQCYPQQLNQVFMNILVNAAQAIEEQGQIRIATRTLDGQVEISISDTGSGIPKKSLSKIFDPFFTTKEVGKGTGLGLNVAYNIIKKHKGTIDVESEVGKGTTFIIRLQTDPDLVE